MNYLKILKKIKIPLKNKIKISTFLFGILVILSGLFLDDFPIDIFFVKDLEKKDFSQDELYFVNRVIDGDTFEIKNSENKEIVRMISINTPEIKSNLKKSECFGESAFIKTKELIENKKVYLEFDNSKGDRDKYDRLLAYVYTEDLNFINLELIKQGFAFENDYGVSYEYKYDFIKAQEFAKENNLGLWNNNNCDY